MDNNNRDSAATSHAIDTPIITDRKNGKYPGCLDCCGIGETGVKKTASGRHIIVGQNGRSMLPVPTLAGGELALNNSKYITHIHISYE